MRTSFFVIIGGFLCGVLWRSFFTVDVYAVLALTLGTSCILLFALFTPHVRTVSLYTVLVVLTIILGVVRVEFATRSFETGLVFVDDSTIETNALVTKEPDVRDEHTILTVSLEGYETSTGVRIYAPHYPSFSYGDRVQLSGKVVRPRAFETESGRLFNYDGYLRKDGTHYEMHYAQLTLLEHGKGNPIVGVLLGLKQQWLEAVSRLIPEPSAALLGGLVVGAKQSLGSEWLTKFRDTGLIHIVVLSGYNLTVVAVFIIWLAGGLPKGARFILGTAGIVAFALMTGAGATVVRASVMAIFALLAQLLTRQYIVLRGLVLAAFLMVLWNPFVLASDPGFQLSFIATLGLILGSPLLERHIGLVPQIFGLRTIVAATLATQIAVLPLLMYQIGEVSLVAPLVNLLTLPIVPFIMAVGFATGVVALVSTTLATPLAAMTYALLSCILFVVEFFASLSWSTIVLPQMPVLMVALLYVALYMMVKHTYIHSSSAIQLT